MTLNRAGYVRHDERTSAMLGDMAQMLLERYHDDLRELHDQAECGPARERELFRESKGLGDVGVDIFFREVQVAWVEFAPRPRADSDPRGSGLTGDARSMRGRCRASRPNQSYAASRARRPARYSWHDRTTVAPSPTAAETRFTDPWRTSPIAKTPGMLVSRG